MRTMTDPIDSDGSWEFVDKDTDSETSSVQSAYDTGLPEDVEEATQNEDDLVGSAWNNKEEFVTDSDIEACAEDPGESDTEADATVIQAAARMSESEHGRMQDTCWKADEDASSDTKSDEENVLPDLEDIQPVMQVVSPDEKLKANHIQDVTFNESTKEVVTSQEDINAPRSDDIIRITDINADYQPSIEELEIPPLSNVSSHSDFERIAPSPDLVTSDPNCEPEVEDTSVHASDMTEPKAVEGLPHSDQSEDGSVDFTVIAAPASPPVEITSHETETSALLLQADLPAKVRTVGMVTEMQWTNQKKVDTASGPDETIQRTVGMVTDHQAPPNQTLLISILMISFGVGFLVGRCPVPSSTILYKERYAPIEKTDIEDSPLSIQYIYHEDDQSPIQNEDSSSFEYSDSLLSALRKAHAANDLMRYKLTVENSRLRSRNRRLRTTISKLKSENGKMATQKSTQELTAEDSATTLGQLKQTCRKEQRLSELNLVNKQKEVQQIRGLLREAEHENAFLNQSVNLCKRLQEQHSNLVALQNASDEKHLTERAQFHERLHGMRLRLQRYRKESKELIQRLAKSKSYNHYLEILAQTSDVLKQQKPDRAEGLQSLHTVSPLVKAITGRSQTCLSGSKFQTQVKWLSSKLKGQKFTIKKLKQEDRLKSMALEMLYNSFGELRRYATCLKQQILILPEDRVKEAPAICGPSQRDDAPTPNPSVTYDAPQCFYPINGTLAVDFSTMNITFQTSEVLPSYELKILASKVKPTLTFNSTLLTASICDLTSNPNMTSDPSNQLVPKVLYAQAMERNRYMQQDLETRTAELSSLQKVCETNNQSLDVSRKEVENVENQLVVIKNEVKRLRKDKKELNKKLYNVTSELKKKSSVKNCIASALNTDKILQQVNGSKAFKVASNMATQVKKVWKKLEKFVNKFGESRDQDKFEEEERKKWSFDDAEEERGEFGKEGRKKERKGHHKFNTVHGKKAGKNGRQRNQHDSQTRQAKKDRKDAKQKHEGEIRGDQEIRQKHHRKFETSQGKKSSQMKEKHHHKLEAPHAKKRDREDLENPSKKRGESSDNVGLKHKKKQDHQKPFGPVNKNKNLGHSSKLLDESDDHKTSKHKEKRERKPFGPVERRKDHHHEKHHKFRNGERPRGQEQFGPIDNKKDHRQVKPREFKSDGRQEDKERKPSQKTEKHDKDENSGKFFSQAPVHSIDDHVKKPKPIPGNLGNPQKDQRGQSHKKTDFGEKLHHLGEAIKEQINTAKATGKKVTTQLMPIYNKFEKVYCDIEKKVSQKSFSEIWESLGKLVDQNGASTVDANEDLNDQEDDSNLGWHWSLYQNVTDLLLPVIEIPGKLELPAWGVDDWKVDWVEPPTKPQKSTTTEEDSDKTDTAGEKEMMDPQWFAHMFKAREDLRKDSEEAPSPEEELDWFLQMFEARDELRRSGVYQDDPSNDQDLDWFLKMFEERARLRFENSKDEKNWYLKMFEARDKARSGLEYTSSDVSNWYAKMFKAREKMRHSHDDDGNWQSKKPMQTEKARGADRYDGPSEEWCQA